MRRMIYEQKTRKGQKKTSALPDSFFGEGTGLKRENLPCISNKEEKLKKTYNFRKDSIEALEKIAKDKNVPVGDILSDLIDKVI